MLRRTCYGHVMRGALRCRNILRNVCIPTALADWMLATRALDILTKADKAYRRLETVSELIFSISDDRKIELYPTYARDISVL